MKNRSLFLLTMIVIFSLIIAGCGGSGAALSDKQVASDLQIELDNTGLGGDGGAKITSVENEKSSSEDNRFNAHYVVEAEGKYIDYVLNADVAYFKYDQGWAMESCEWTYVSHNVARYPDDEEIKQLLNDAGLGNAELVETTKESNQISCATRNEFTWTKFINGYVEMTSQWVCSAENGEFYLSGQYETGTMIVPNKKLEGTWNLIETVDTGAVSVSNVTENGFVVDVNSASLKKENISMELSNSKFFPEDGYVMLSYNGTDSEGHSMRIDIRMYDDLREYMGVTCDVTWDIVLYTGRNNAAVTYAYINTKE